MEICGSDHSNELGVVICGSPMERGGWVCKNYSSKCNNLYSYL